MQLEKKQTRRQYYIYREIQLKYIRLTLLLMVLVCLVMGYTIYDTTWGIFAKRLAMVCPSENIKGVYSFFNSTLILRLLIMIPVIIVATMYLSHRVAGLVFRIGKELNEVAQGDLTRRIVLRENDDLKRLASEFNWVISRIDSLLLNIKARISEFQNSIKEAAQRGKINKEQLEKWLNDIEKISQELNRFKTSS